MEPNQFRLLQKHYEYASYLFPHTNHFEEKVVTMGTFDNLQSIIRNMFRLPMCHFTSAVAMPVHLYLKRQAGPMVYELLDSRLFKLTNYKTMVHSFYPVFEFKFTYPTIYELFALHNQIHSQSFEQGITGKFSTYCDMVLKFSQ